MREIIFRGKRCDNGEWIGGSLVHQTLFYGDETDCYHILHGGEFDCDFYDAEEVIPETIGQFTGLTDKNGKKIFEGDIVKEADVVHNGEIQIHGNVFSVSMRKGCWVVIPASDTEEWDFLNSYLPYLEVIGNIHDNPELLEVSEDGK